MSRKRDDCRHRYLLPRITELPLEARIRAFREALRMRNDGLTAVEIFEELYSRHLPIRYDTVLSWISGTRNPNRRLNVVRHFDGDLVELFGLVTGDGYWGKIVKTGVYSMGRISYGSKDLELAQRAGWLMARVLGRARAYRPYWSGPNRVFVVECGSKHLAEMFDLLASGESTLVWKFRIRFLRGIYDAEGCITVRTRNGHLYPRIFLTNSDLDLIKLVRRMLNSVGIETTLELNTRAGKEKVILGRETATRKNVYNVCIGRRSFVLDFRRTVGFRVNRKRALLSKVIRDLRLSGNASPRGPLLFVQNHNFPLAG